MFYNLRKTLSKRLFDLRCRGIFDTPPVTLSPQSKVVVLSQIYHPDLTMFMLAAKSFMRYVSPRLLVLVDDGLTEDDRATIRRHFSDVRFIATAEVRNERCPKGGCWERFLAITDLVADDYVIQLDADTLTMQAPTEVLECLRSGRSFTLGTDTGRETVPLAVAGEFARATPNDHIQNVAERALPELPEAEKYRYVRGCAGFAGYAPGQVDRARVEAFSALMSGIVGAERWRQWGSEQFTSNFMVANIPDSVVLPVEQYPFWKPGVDLGQAKLIHFFGTYRFKGGGYARLSRRLIKQLLAR
ncbi:MAG: hypothetical protein AB1831_09680 [Pseudomonadota bacterium]